MSAGVIFSMPVDRDAVEIGRGAEGEAASSVSLCAVSPPPMSSVGIGLGVAQPLRLGEHIGERAARSLPSGSG